MAKVVETRRETAEEKALRAWFAAQETARMENLEAGARQIMQLVTAFYGLVFGVVALGSDSLPASLRTPPALILSLGSILSLFVALAAALAVIYPAEQRYRPASLSDQKRVYENLIKRKQQGLIAATLAFGLGLFMFALLIGIMLLAR